MTDLEKRWKIGTDEDIWFPARPKKAIKRADSYEVDESELYVPDYVDGHSPTLVGRIVADLWINGNFKRINTGSCWLKREEFFESFLEHAMTNECLDKALEASWSDSSFPMNNQFDIVKKAFLIKNRHRSIYASFEESRYV